MSASPWSASNPPPLPRHLDQVCDRFEAAWRAVAGGGARPRIEEFLVAVSEAEQPALLGELLALEVGYRRQQGDAPTLSEYQQRFPVVPAAYLARELAGDQETAENTDDLQRSTVANPVAVSLTSIELVGVLRRTGLLNPEQSQELTSAPEQFPQAQQLARELMQRGWLTAYQANQVFQGRANTLILGDFVLLERLGEGGMGQVFKARSRKLGRVVALKIIRKECLARPNAVRRFQREIQACSQLSHRNIIHAFDAAEVQGTHFLVMEYSEGMDLRKVLATRGPLPIDRACDYIRQVAQGLQHAHEKGLVHRDIKPSNLLLCTSSAGAGRGGEVVKLLDLGLARLATAEAEDNNSTLTDSGAVLGTPDYIAPEQIRDAHSADIRSDLYSLGCTLYQLLTGQAPFPGKMIGLKLLQHQSESPRPIEQLRPEVPPAVAAIVHKLMAKKPEDRFQTPAELVAALDRASANPAGEAATKASSHGRSRVRWLVVGVLMVILLGLLLIVGGSTLLSGGRRGSPINSPKAPAVDDPRLRLLVPAYFYPAGPGLADWERLLEASRSAEVIAIVNPSSGPGEKSDPNYVDVVKRADQAGLRTLGYVRTSYGKRPLEEVKADVDRWVRFYPEVGGVFLDEQASTIDRLDYYVAVSRFVRQKRPNALIVTNPGTVCAREYLSRSAADVVCLTERGEQLAPHLPAWVKEETPRRFAALIHEIDRPEQMRQVIRDGIARGIGYIFVTDGRQPNQWERLPRWWNAEVDAVREVNSPPKE